MPLALEGRAVGVMLPTSNGAVVTLLALMSGGRVPAMINFTAGAANILGACRAAQVDTIVTARAFVEKARLEKLIAADRAARAHRLPGRYAQDGELWRQAARGAAGEKAAGRAQAGRLGGDPVHLRHRRRAEGRRALAPQRAHERGASRGADRFRARGQAVHGAARVPFLRLHRRHRAAADFRRADLLLSLAAALPHRAGTGLRHLRDLPLRHRHVPRRLCPHGATRTTSARCATSSPAPSRSRNRPAAPIWKNSACASSKATA